ncbi:hypothetical protein BCR34DRAFT_250203 [Clohesyomyces aquaticus]|uniref:Uncharacterized protein n=1 Tax=Clohesyomyces aquaticus TaxID=1231657 RepID=A0A1Y1Y5A9_9PLEO|nr:hypothetical protein BCR34DRAFT_250203 [Clohesyomyces aquaticus]
MPGSTVQRGGGGTEFHHARPSIFVSEGEATGMKLVKAAERRRKDGGTGFGERILTISSLASSHLPSQQAITRLTAQRLDKAFLSDPGLLQVSSRGWSEHSKQTRLLDCQCHNLACQAGHHKPSQNELQLQTQRSGTPCLRLSRFPFSLSFKIPGKHPLCTHPLPRR